MTRAGGLAGRRLIGVKWLTITDGGQLGIGFVWTAGAGSELCGTGEGLPVPSHATTKRPTRMIIGVVVFAVGVLAGALIAAWVVPPA